MNQIKLSIFLLFFFTSIFSFGQKKTNSLVTENTESGHTAKFNINNISTYIRNNGDCDLDPNNDSGFEFPQGIGKYIVYESGIVWGGKINGKIHVGGNSYNQGIIGGRILENGTSQNPNDLDVRVFRVRSDYNTANLTLEIEDEQLFENDIRAQYEKDWIEWPAEYGAPFNDIDNNGIYDPEIDIAGVPGADQTLWYVANDFDTAQCRDLYGSDPMKLEIQVTVWGYKNRSLPYNDVMFKKYKLINKNDKNIDSMFISKWSDPDVGGAGDDYVGCDTLLDLSFSYNGDDDDTKYGSTIPAVGYQFLQGPLIDGDATDVGIKNGEGIIGKKNIGMSAFSFFIGGDDVYNDPDLGNYEYGTLAIYNIMQGLPSNFSKPFIDPTNGLNTKFTLAGDPINQSGWTDGILHGPGDRRMITTSGPFTLAADDTQEVIMAEISSVGKDRLNSVKILKYYAGLLQKYHSANPVQLPNLNSPIVEKIESRDGIFLSWDDESLYQNIEQYDSNGYKFQGYNVYQLYSAISLKENAKRIATFDIVDGITAINGTVMSDDGKPIDGIQQFGSDSGISREFFISKDHINDDELIKGKEYYFGVSAYTYNEDSVNNNNKESQITSIRVNYIRELSGPNYGDTLEVKHTKGIGGAVFPIVKRPSAMTGLDYKISFEKILNDSSEFETVWHLDRVDSNRILANQPLLRGGPNDYLYSHISSPIIDGLEIQVYDIIEGIKSFSLVANGNGKLNSIEAAAPEWQGFPVPLDSENNPLRPTDNQQVGSGKWMFHTGDPGQSRGTYETFKVRTIRNDNFDRLVPYDWEMRFTSRGSWALRWFEDDYLVKVPFELWNTGISTPDDPSDDYRLIPYFLSTASVGGPQTDPDGLTYQIDPTDHAGSGGDNDPQTPWIYWIIPHAHDDGSPGTIGYDEYLSQIDTTIVGDVGNVSFSGGTEVMARTILFNWNGDDISDGIVNPGTQLFPEEGSIFRIETNNYVEPGVDEFTFNSPLTIVTERKEIPGKYLLNQNYPNPFNPSTVINYSIPKNGLVNISVYNILGQKVKDLVNSNLKAGNYYITFNGSNLASGVYIYRIETNDFIKSKKMLLLK